MAQSSVIVVYGRKAIVHLTLKKMYICGEFRDMRRCPGEAGKELKLLITSEDECGRQSEGCQGIATFVINII